MSESLPPVKNVPSFRGRLKLGFIRERHCCILQQLVSINGKLHYRFVDFRSSPSEVGQLVIGACSDTIETLSATWKSRECPFILRYNRRSGTTADENGLPLNLVDVVNLRSLQSDEIPTWGFFSNDSHDTSPSLSELGKTPWELMKLLTAPGFGGKDGPSSFVGQARVDSR